MDDETIQRNAEKFARKHKKNIAKRLTDTTKFPSDEVPVSVFMAGSPGAGKTESARNLIQKFSDETSILHIDPDSLRKEFAEYNGKNSSLFQAATSIIADNMHDCALKQKQSFVFDSTLTNLDRSIENIDRSLKKQREVFIVYVYQDPLQAWEFVQERERKEGRMIPKNRFIDQYFQARENVTELKRVFGKKIQVDVIVKNIDGTNFGYRENVDAIDSHVPERYSRDVLEKLL